jgi:hypothetical protein
VVNVVDTGWQLLGEVAIESGRLVLMDPGDEDALDRALEDGPDGLVSPLIGLPAEVPVGLVVAPGMGDGLYPVEGRVEIVEDRPRVAELRVRFLPHPVIGYDLGVAEG